MTWSVEGRDIPARSALAWGHDDSVLSLLLSTEERGCDDIESAKKTDLWIKAVAALMPNGERSWQLSHLAFAGSSIEPSKQGLEVHSADPTSEVRLSLDVVAPTLTVSGTLTPSLCGKRPRPATGNDPRPQPGLHLGVAGRTFEVLGVTMRPTGKPEAWEINVGSAPLSCGGTTAVGDVEVRLFLKSDRVERAYLYGDVIPGESEAAKPETGSTVDVEQDAADPAAYLAKFDARFTHQGYAVELTGDASALWCE